MTEAAEGGTVSARDARTGPARDRATSGKTSGSARRSAAAARAGAHRHRPARSRRARRSPAPATDGAAGRPGRRPGPGGARVTGVLLVLAALAGAAARSRPTWSSAARS